MLVATLRWREEFNVDAALKEEFPEEVFGKVGRVYGKDKGGRPVVWVKRMSEGSCLIEFTDITFMVAIKI